VEELEADHFPDLLDLSYSPALKPDVYGETIEELHERVAYVMYRAIERIDSIPNGPKSIIICTHAAIMISLGRILTGKMPEDVTVDDFQCYTASLSAYRRKSLPKHTKEVDKWDPLKPKMFPQVDWKGNGVLGEWISELNSDTSHLSGGAQRGWYAAPRSKVDMNANASRKFFGDESYVFNPYSQNETKRQSLDAEKGHKL
jgi:transcription factor C subunit 7